MLGASSEGKHGKFALGLYSAACFFPVRRELLHSLDCGAPGGTALFGSPSAGPSLHPGPEVPQGAPKVRFFMIPHQPHKRSLILASKRSLGWVLASDRILGWVPSSVLREDDGRLEHYRQWNIGGSPRKQLRCA